VGPFESYDQMTSWLIRKFRITALLEYQANSHQILDPPKNHFLRQFYTPSSATSAIPMFCWAVMEPSGILIGNFQVLILSGLSILRSWHTITTRQHLACGFGSPLRLKAGTSRSSHWHSCGVIIYPLSTCHPLGLSRPPSYLARGYFTWIV
jgi:hypothetical protein